ncbi:MAG: 50S ribosomal protein L6 [Clostridia bacterium]|nr:50S ribosomal protein L6 [Clostridia bacterium]
MSRIGKRPIAIPAGVECNVDGQTVTIKGAKGTLTQTVDPIIAIELKDGVMTLTRPDDSNKSKALHGLYNSLLTNMVKGVTEGYSKKLEINGVGYRAQLQGKDLNMNLGYSHPVVMTPPEGITIEVPNANTIIISGADKQQVGQFAAVVREKRLPEPYKGKGIKYDYEHIRRKEGKAGKA